MTYRSHYHPGKGNIQKSDKTSRQQEAETDSLPPAAVQQTFPSTAKLFAAVLKKIFRWKTLPLLTNYFIRKSGLNNSLQTFEDTAFTKLNNFFER